MYRYRGRAPKHKRAPKEYKIAATAILAPVVIPAAVLLGMGRKSKKRRRKKNKLF